MRTLCKKALAFCLVAALALTCFVGTFSVSAAEFGATITVAPVTVEQGETAVPVVLAVDSAAAGINEALIKVSSTVGTIDAEATLVKDAAGTAYTEDELNALDYSIKYAQDVTDYGSFYLSGKTFDLTTTSVFIKVVFTVAADKAAGDYAVAIDIPTDKVIAATGNEDVVKFTYEEAKITIVAPHVHNVIWTPDTENAGYHTSSCNAEGCPEFTGATEACADGEDEDLLCDKCGYDLTPEVQEPVYDASLGFKGKTALFESDYSLMYYVPVSLGDSWHIDVSRAVYSANTRVEDKEVTLTIEDVHSTTKPGDGNEYYLVALRGIATKEVANEIVAVLHNEVDGVDYYGAELTYNLVDYALNRISKNKANEVKYLQAFLNYAAACQVRFGYNTANLANNSLSEDAKAISLNGEITQNSKNDEYEVIENATATLNGFAPSYEDKMTLGTICKVPDNYVEAGLQIRYVFVDYTGATKTEYVSLAESEEYTAVAGGYRLVMFTGLAIREVRTPVLVTVVDANGNAISNTRQYSFEVYAASRKTTSADYEPARAMIAFGDWFKYFKEN